LRKHWSVREAAERLEVDSDTLFGWELGKVRPRGYNIQKLIDVYGMSAEELDLAPPRRVSPDMAEGQEEQGWPVPRFVKEDLTMRLLALGFIDLTFHQVQAEPIQGFIYRAGTALYEQGDCGQAMAMLEQLIDIEQLTAKQLMPEPTRVEVINTMTLISLRQPKKDKDLSLRLWTEGINGARALHSEQRFREALLAYEIIRGIWADEEDIKALRDLTVHWL
jgi:transcriptional regulator with XRE-family HTH domain